MTVFGFKTRFLALAALCCALLGVGPALACSVVPARFAQRAAAAKTIFVGTVRTVENGAAYFHVEKGIKGIADGATFDVDEMRNTCGISFAAGQRWLYMGKTAASGSMMLVSETGIRMDDNIAAVTAHFGAAALAAKDDIVGGTVTASCAPWDGAAFDIRLEGSACAISVYARLGAKSAGKTYPLDGKMAAGHGSIICCPATGVSGQPCPTLKGTLKIGHVGPDAVTGMLETATDPEHHSRTVFKLRRVHRNVACG